METAKQDNNKKIIIIILIFIAVGGILAIVMYYSSKLRAMQIAQDATGTQDQVRTVTTGGTGINTNTTGGSDISVPGSATNGAPVYQNGWDGFKLNDSVENIYTSKIDIPYFAIGPFGPQIWDAPVGSFQVKRVTDKSGIANVSVGKIGTIRYIDSGKMQIVNGKTMYSFTREQFNNGESGKFAKLSGKLGVKILS